MTVNSKWHAFPLRTIVTVVAAVLCNLCRQQRRGEHLVHRSGDGAPPTRGGATRCRGGHAGPLLGRSAGRGGRDQARRRGDAVGSGFFSDTLTRSSTQPKESAFPKINRFRARVIMTLWFFVCFVILRQMGKNIFVVLR